MIEWLRRHPHLTWSLAWGVTALGLYTADVASSPRLGPLWPAILFGAVAWSIAGATTLCGTRVLAGLFVWSAGYAIAFYLAATWTVGVQLGPTNLPEFVAALAGWAAGAAVATLVTTLWLVSRARPVLVVAFSVIWGVGFFIGGYVGIVGAMYGAQAGKALLAFVGNQRLALTLGCAIGASPGGLGRIVNWFRGSTNAAAGHLGVGRLTIPTSLRLQARTVDVGGSVSRWRSGTRSQIVLQAPGIGAGQRWPRRHA